MTTLSEHMRSALLEHLESSVQAVRAGEELIPAWRISTPEGSFLIFTRFDHDKPDQLEILMHLMRRFMVWKQASRFVLGLEMWLGAERTRQGDEAVVAIVVSREAPPAAALRRIQRKAGHVELGEIEWLSPDQIDRAYLELLPGRIEALDVGEAAFLERVFGEDGELPAMRVAS
jgi:hypothetical protein